MKEKYYVSYEAIFEHKSFEGLKETDMDLSNDGHFQSFYAELREETAKRFSKEANLEEYGGLDIDLVTIIFYAIHRTTIKEG